MARRRPTRAELDELAVQLRDLEREAALVVPCPPRPRGCGVSAGERCWNHVTGRPLQLAAGHPARMADAARSTPTTGPVTAAGPYPSRSPDVPVRSSAA